jgi:hypothetical protein
MSFSSLQLKSIDFNGLFFTTCSLQLMLDPLSPFFAARQAATVALAVEKAERGKLAEVRRRRRRRRRGEAGRGKDLQETITLKRRPNWKASVWLLPPITVWHAVKMKRESLVGGSGRGAGAARAHSRSRW